MDSARLSRRSLLASATALAAPALCAPGLLASRAMAAEERFGQALETARSFDQLHCLIVAHRGKTVVEEVLRGPSAGRPVNVKSVSKTIVAALMGAALDRGEVPSADATLGEVAPRLVPRDAEPGVAEITLAQLVSMRSGLERTSGGNYGAWVSSPNWVADALSRPFVAPAGGRMLYSTGNSHVLGAVLAEVTGASLLAQARERLGRPLGIEIPPWTQDPQGRYLGGNQMALSPRGMLRFGEMVRAGGIWEGSRVLSEAWISESLVPRTRSPWSGLGYGYGWFLGEVPAEAGGGPLAIARGYGGQIIAVAPGAEMTVAITSDPDRPARSRGYFGDLMGLLGQILAAA
ncbi:MAG: serine hydrolase [Pseudomonadota bacterium]